MRAAIVAMICLVGSAAAAAGPGPCQKLEAACTSAGYFPGGNRVHKGLQRDCMKPLLAGQFVDDVLASTDEVNACRAARGKHPKRSPPPPP